MSNRNKKVTIHYGGDKVAPKPQNQTYDTVDVPGGSIKRKLWVCAGCEEKKARSRVQFITKSERLSAWITTSFGSWRTYAAGSSTDYKTPSFPYCGECFDAATEEWFKHKPKLRKTVSGPHSYAEATCASCEGRVPVESATPFVINPTKARYKNDGWATGAGFRRIRGNGVYCLCSSCYAGFWDDWVSRIDYDSEEYREF